MSSIETSCFPDTVFLEREIFRQAVNFEFRCKNASKSNCILIDILAKAFDKSGDFIFRNSVNMQGVSPSISIVPERKLEHEKMLEILNPLAEFPLDYDFERLDFRLRFTTEDERLLRSEVSVKPRIYEQKVLLDLPFDGRCIVDDGHDFLSHHRRIPLTHPIAQQIGLAGNANRFAYDFMFVDSKGSLYDNDGLKNEGFYGWGKTVLCPGDGEVVAVAHDVPDNMMGQTSYFDHELWFKDPERAFKLAPGNHVYIDHGNSEFSALAHMQKDTVRADIGDKLIRGEPVGKMGNSGDSYYPHIHYQQQKGRDERTSEGLPSRFREFELILGNTSKSIQNLCPNTGMIINHQSRSAHL
jgi:hypothetical protein